MRPTVWGHWLMHGVPTVILAIAEPRNRPQLMRKVFELMRDLGGLPRWIHSHRWR